MQYDGVHWFELASLYFSFFPRNKCNKIRTSIYIQTCPVYTVAISVAHVRLFIKEKWAAFTMNLKSCSQMRISPSLFVCNISLRQSSKKATSSSKMEACLSCPTASKSFFSLLGAADAIGGRGKVPNARPPKEIFAAVKATQASPSTAVPLWIPVTVMMLLQHSLWDSNCSCLSSSPLHQATRVDAKNNKNASPSILA